MRSKRRHAPLLFIPLSALMLLAFLTSAPLHGQEKKDTLTFRIMAAVKQVFYVVTHDAEGKSIFLLLSVEWSGSQESKKHQSG